MKYHSTRLLVQDFADSYRFYRHVLGLEHVLGDEGSKEGVYCELRAGADVVIALFKRPFMAHAVGIDHLPPEGTPAQDAFCISIGVPSVDELYKKLTAQKVRFVNAPHDQVEWMIRVAHLRDPDGNLVEINEPLNMESRSKLSSQDGKNPGAHV